MQPMKYILLFVWVLLFCNCRTPSTFTHNTKPSDTLIRLVTYGFAPLDIVQIESEVAHKWGFYYQCVAGCTVSQADIDSFNAYNTIAERPLVAKYGKNWRKKYGKELSIALATPAHSCFYFHYNKEVDEIRKELQIYGDTLFYHFKPAKIPGAYNVDLVGWQHLDSQKTWVSYGRYYVNYGKSIVKQTSTKVRSDTAFLHNNIYFSDEDYKAYPRN